MTCDDPDYLVPANIAILAWYYSPPKTFSLKIEKMEYFLLLSSIQYVIKTGWKSKNLR